MSISKSISSNEDNNDRSENQNDRKLLILYGSETGTAEDVANQISRRARRLRIRTTVSPMDDQDPNSVLENTLIVFVCSTTGQGSQPKNMKKLWRFLKRSDLPKDLFGSLRFSVFGLGDSKYQKFNWASRMLYRRLVQLGGVEFYRRGEADDQNPNGIDTTLIPWLEGLEEALLKVLPVPEGLSTIPRSTCLPSSFRLRQKTDPSSSSDSRRHPQSYLDQDERLTATLTRNERVTSQDHWQDTRHLEFDFSEELDFEPGSVAELLPQNDDEDVEKILDLMGWKDQADQVYELSLSDPNETLPVDFMKHSTLREIFKDSLDFTSVPKRSFIEWISHFSSNPIEKEKLEELFSPDGLDDFYDYICRPRRTILEVLEEFKSVKVPLDFIFEVFPRIKPRQYSISSSSKVYRNQVHLLVAIVKFKTRLYVPRKGLCSNWLSKLGIGSKVLIKIEDGSLKFPKDFDEPVICIGPGTGIAPFRSFVQDRFSSILNDRKSRILKKDDEDEHERDGDEEEGTENGRGEVIRKDGDKKSDKKILNNLIIYGCRNFDRDFYFKDEWKEFESLELCKLHWAASRDQVSKRYVQDEIEEHGDEVYELIENRKGSIFISGSSGNMPEGVKNSILKVYKKFEDLKRSNEFKQNQDQIDLVNDDDDDWERFKLKLKKLELVGKLQEETWS